MSYGTCVAVRPGHRHSNAYNFIDSLHVHLAAWHRLNLCHEVGTNACEWFTSKALQRLIDRGDFKLSDDTGNLENDTTRRKKEPVAVLGFCVWGANGAGIFVWGG